MMKSFSRRSSPFAKRDDEVAPFTSELKKQRPQQHVSPQEINFAKIKSGDRLLSPTTEDNRLKRKFEAIDVLLQILLHQDELTLKEYTINDSKIKVLVIEDTEF